jgi:hypothetical protein
VVFEWKFLGERYASTVPNWKVKIWPQNPKKRVAGRPSYEFLENSGPVYSWDRITASRDE